MKKLINNIPNLITMSRIVSCILGATFFTLGNIPIAIGCYVYGAVSDAFDGFLARKLNAVTELGKKLDPISDKLYALSLMAPSIILGNSLMLIPLVFEGIISAINIYAELKYKQTYTEKVGKLKTIMLFPTMILGLLTTKIPNLAILFVPSLFISTNLQAKSIMAYATQLDESKRMANLNNDNLDCNIETMENKIDNENTNNIGKEKNETTGVVKKNTKNKVKKLIRKKDYNDRY